MSKLIVLVFITLLVGLAYFNGGTVVDFALWKDVNHNVPLVALILASTAIGIVFMLIIYSIRDARRYYDSWQIQRQHKKEDKIRESYSKGLDAFFASRYKEAGELFNHVIESEPAHSNALLRLGDIAYFDGEFAGAREFYLKALEVKPRSIEVLLSLVNVAEARQKWQDALKYLDSLLEIDDENIKVLFRKREIHEKHKSWEELIEIQNKIVKCKLPAEQMEEENEKLTGYKYELARYYVETGATDKAIKALRAIIKHDDKYVSAYIALADAHIKDGNAKETESTLLKGYESTQSQVILIRLEDYYIAEGEPGTIIDLYQKSTQKNPKDVMLRFFFAKLYYRLEMIDHVLETINAVDPLTMNFPAVHSLLGGVYERRSENDKALDEYKMALKADKPFVVPYRCSQCNYTSTEWPGRCPECYSWNSFVLDVNTV